MFKIKMKFQLKIREMSTFVPPPQISVINTSHNALWIAKYKAIGLVYMGKKIKN